MWQVAPGALWELKEFEYGVEEKSRRGENTTKGGKWVPAPFKPCQRI